MDDNFWEHPSGDPDDDSDDDDDEFMGLTG
jgi:hypothetical protein